MISTSLVGLLVVGITSLPDETQRLHGRSSSHRAWSLRQWLQAELTGTDGLLVLGLPFEEPPATGCCCGGNRLTVTYELFPRQSTSPSSWKNILTRVRHGGWTRVTQNQRRNDGHLALETRSKVCSETASKALRDRRVSGNIHGWSDTLSLQVYVREPTISTLWPKHHKPEGSWSPEGLWHSTPKNKQRPENSQWLGRGFLSASSTKALGSADQGSIPTPDFKRRQHLNQIGKISISPSLRTSYHDISHPGASFPHPAGTTLPDMHYCCGN